MLAFADHSYIAVAIVKSKMVSIAIHMSLPTPSPHTPDKLVFTPLERIADETQPVVATPVLAGEKNSGLGSLVTARCCFGIASMEKNVYVVGQYISDSTVCSEEDSLP